MLASNKTNYAFDAGDSWRDDHFFNSPNWFIDAITYIQFILFSFASIDFPLMSLSNKENSLELYYAIIYSDNFHCLKQ